MLYDVYHMVAYTPPIFPGISCATPVSLHNCACTVNCRPNLNFTTPTQGECSWATSAAGHFYECNDGFVCDSDDSSCCNAHNGRAKCPVGTDMCDFPDTRCANGQDYCCN